MLDPDKAHAWIEHHFDTVTDEEFIANVRRLDPEFAEELWGTPCAAAKVGDQRLDPQIARAFLEQYHATATDQQILDDLRRHSPELARRLGVDALPPAQRAAPVHRGARGFFAFLSRSVLKLFS